MKKTSPEIPLSNLSEEAQKGIEHFDAATDELYTLRNQLDLFYKHYRAYLPPRARIRDLYAMRVEGKKTTDLIDWSKRQPNKDTVQDYVQRAYIEAAFDHALDTYALVQERHGDWGARPLSLSQEESAIRDYYRERYTIKAATIREREELLDKLTVIEEAIDRVRSDGGMTSAIHQAAIRGIYKDKEQAEDDLKKILLKNPDTYLALKEQELRESKQVFDKNGSIVETPYVQRKIARVKEILSSNRPVFIHGELGTGKTELAKHIARTVLSRAHLARWEVENPRPREPQAPKKREKQLLHVWQEQRNEWRVALAVWEQERRVQAEPLLIAGRKDIAVESVTAGRGIRRKETPSPAEQVKTISEAWDAFLISADPQSQLDQATRDRMMSLHERAWLEAFKSPVETVALLGPLLQAMEEGRPLIIDEMNAIPHNVLIVMNDLLTRKAGDMIPALLPGMKPFRIQEGFCVLATGNYKPEDGKMYVGRQQIDAAFLSRFGIVSYDYLPMEREEEVPGLSPEEQRAHREKNELYHMLVTRLLDPDLTARLPQGGLEQVEMLARVARMVQDAFSGKEMREFQVGSAQIKPSAVLSENVLSIRHLVPIIDQWKRDGYVHDLDDYIFREYVSRSLGSRPNEALFLYSILNIQGDFFQDSNGWPHTSEPEKILNFPIEEKFHAIISGKRVSASLRERAFKTYSTQEIITALYGPAPARTNISQKSADRFAARFSQETQEEHEDVIEKLAREQKAARIRDTLSALAGEGFSVLPQTK